MEVGAMLAGKYRVDRVLAQGGMGLVVQATHLQLGQPVAVKFLLPEVLGNHEVVQRFLREAQAAVRLKSEHVARVIDVGQLETGAPYMVLEYLEGADLSQLPRDELTPGAIVDLMLQACEALAEAHALGIVHRDIKPANFFITRRASGAPLLKVLDFGISKSQSTVDAGLTATQAVMGTPAYMSPEQMRSTRDVDARSDIWSLGVVMYELFEGMAPFQADTFTAFAIAVATEPTRPMTKPLPGHLAAVVYRCLEKDRERRFRTVAELAAALAPFAKSATQAAITLERTGATAAQPPTIIAGGGRAISTITAASGAVTGAPQAKRRWPLIAGLVVVACAAVAAAAVVSSRGGASKTPPAEHAAAAPSSPPAGVPAAARAPAAPPPAAPPAPAAPTAAAAAPPAAPPTGTAAPAPAPGPAPTQAAQTAKATAKPGTKHTPRHPAAAAPSHRPPPSAPPAQGSASDDDILGARH